jgi:hypothetical protein
VHRKLDNETPAVLARERPRLRDRPSKIPPRHASGSYRERRAASSSTPFVCLMSNLDR